MFVVTSNAMVGVQPINATELVQKHPLGTMVDAYDPLFGHGKFVYLAGVASTAKGDFVTFNQDDGTTARLAANAIGPVGVAMSDNVASQYGWYQVYGKAVGNVSASFADNANCYATATAGEVDDAVVAGDLVKNCKGASAIGTITTHDGTTITTAAEMEIQFPFMDDGLTA